MSHVAQPTGRAGQRKSGACGALAGILAAIVVALLVVAVGAVALLWNTASPPEDLIITEVVSSNGSTLADEDGDFSDWIELHNPRDHAIDTEDYRLTDNPERQWMLPARVLQPGEFLVVFASGKDRVSASGELHTDFRISRDGATVALLAADGTTVLDELEVPALPRDASFGIDAVDAARACFFAVPTPAAKNAPECFDDNRLGAPEFSTPSGAYDDAFELTITSEAPGATIVYTLDGSYPDLERNPEATKVYSEPLSIENRTSEPNVLALVHTPSPLYTMPRLDAPIPKGTVIRARSEFSNLASAAYFVGLGRNASSLPIVSVTVDPTCMFDEQDGIYVPGRIYAEYRASDAYNPNELRPPANYAESGREWECPRSDPEGAAVHYCDAGQACTEPYGVGVRVHGAWSRMYAMKSLRLYARDEYGSPSFAGFGPFDPEFGDHKRLILRQSGQDLKLMFRDAYLQSLLDNMMVDRQAYQPTSVYLNGEYWGLMNLRERYDEHYLAAVHGADPDSVALIKRHWEVSVGPANSTDSLVDFIKRLEVADAKAPATVDFIHETIDIDSFFDMVLTNIFIVNIDWPNNNTAVWRQYENFGEGTLDGRWRWMVFDLDHHGGAVGFNNSDYSILNGKMARPADPHADNGIPFMFHRFMENPELKARFLTRFADHLNTAFLPEHTTAELQKFAETVAPEIPAHIERWGQVQSMDAWWSEVDGLEGFMNRRPDTQRNQLVSYFSLQGIANVKVTTPAAGGHVHVNTIDIASTTPGVLDATNWSGKYFRGLPVTITAMPVEGYRFVRWEGAPEGAGTGETLSFVLDGDVAVAPVFAPVE